MVSVAPTCNQQRDTALELWEELDTYNVRFLELKRRILPFLVRKHLIMGGLSGFTPVSPDA